jgi:predicted homoserine dehydrogenase-like protein
MHLYRELRRRQQFGRVIKVAVSGIGSMGKGIALQLRAMPGLDAAVLINRDATRAVEAWISAGFAREDVVVSNDSRLLDLALEQGLPCVCNDPEVAVALSGIEVLVEATGTVAHAARSVLAAIHANKHVVAMNAELDATLGCYLAERARQRGVVYTYADGDQPGVLMRILEWVAIHGFEIIVAVNCKGFLDVSATPETSKAWASRMKTSPHMVCAFTDGTKMNLENAIVANATGLVPEVRGMHGIHTTQKDALRDFSATLGRSGVVDYTLGGDFGGGVFVIGRCADWERVGHYFDYLKMGSGPDYLFFRPYHLCHLETPLSVAEAVLYREPTIAPKGAPVAEVVAVAKRNLHAGERLDGMGGYTFYGQVDTVERGRDFLPAGLAEGALVVRPVQVGEPIPACAVEPGRDDYARNLRQLQDTLFSTFQPTPFHVHAARN